MKLWRRNAAGRSTRELGRTAERRAAEWLEGQGYRIVERNIRNAGGEIDLVAREQEVLCFVEVKSRGSAEFGSAVSGVDRRKRRRLVAAARHYLAQRGAEEELCRFDVLALDFVDREWRFSLFRDAFWVEE